MRSITFILIFIFQLSYAQVENRKILDLISKSLQTSKDYEGVKQTIIILGNSIDLYKDIFKYVPSINPLNPKKLKRVSSKFGKRFHPIDKVHKAHLGIDISAKLATPVHAAASGTVIKVIRSDFGYGNQVVIKHKYGFKTRYAHLHSFIVKKGDTVKKGKVIGLVGTSGKSTGNHLHFEIIKNGNNVNPEPFFKLNI